MLSLILSLVILVGLIVFFSVDNNDVAVVGLLISAASTIALSVISGLNLAKARRGNIGGFGYGSVARYGVNPRNLGFLS